MAKVLCIDDDTSITALFAVIIRSCGYEPIELNDSTLVLGYLGDPNLFAVLTDYMMPGMDGAKVLELVRTHRPDVRRIMVTAAAAEYPMRDLLRSGLAQQIIAKPPTMTDIKAALI